MEDQSNEEEDPSSNERWTCEACGCNTNQPSDSSCSICGTSNSGKFMFHAKTLDRTINVRQVRRGSGHASGYSIAEFCRYKMQLIDICIIDRNRYDKTASRATFVFAVLFLLLLH
jgi:hypothetical protein